MPGTDFEMLIHRKYSDRQFFHISRFESETEIFSIKKKTFFLRLIVNLDLFTENFHIFSK